LPLGSRGTLVVRLAGSALHDPMAEPPVTHQVSRMKATRRTRSR
jgi:hypothetical protein